MTTCDECNQNKCVFKLVVKDRLSEKQQEEVE
jgi:hypothetical protein